MGRMSLPKGVSDAVWNAALAYAAQGAAAIDPTDENIVSRRQLIYHRIDLSATTEFKFFDTTAAAQYITNLEKGRMQQGRVAVLQGFAFDICIGRDIAGTMGVSEVLGTNEAAAADGTDAAEIASAYAAMAAKVDLLRHGKVSLWLGTKVLFEDEWGLSRFCFPGGVDISGPGYSLSGAFPANVNTKVGVLQANNGLASTGNMFALAPNQIIHENLQIKGRLNVQTAPTIPASYKLTAVMAFDAQVFGDANNT